MEQAMKNLYSLARSLMFRVWWQSLFSSRTTQIKYALFAINIMSKSSHKSQRVCCQSCWLGQGCKYASAMCRHAIGQKPGQPMEALTSVWWCLL